MKPVRTVLHVSLPDDTFQRIKQIAETERRPQSYVARELIEKSLFEMQAVEDAPKKATRR